jgi:hypothetical protein
LFHCDFCLVWGEFVLEGEAEGSGGAVMVRVSWRCRGQQVPLHCALRNDKNAARFGMTRMLRRFGMTNVVRASDDNN